MAEIRQVFTEDRAKLIAVRNEVSSKTWPEIAARVA